MGTTTPGNDSSKGSQPAGAKRPHMALVAAGAVAVVAIAFVGFTLVLGKRPSTEPAPPVTTTQAGTVATPDPSGTTATNSNPSLPFTVSGVDASAEVAEVGSAPAATLSGEWAFGGDYAEIGSVPVDAQTVFGSATGTPNDVSSYAAALIKSDGTLTPLETPERPAGMSFYEPQDGTASASGVVWRGSVSSNLPQAGTDNWVVRFWDKATGQARTLGTAESLNGTKETPTAPGDVVPTANDENAYFTSATKDGNGSWKLSVIALPLDGSGAKTLADGNYPAAVEGGVLYATDPVNEGAREAPRYARVARAANSGNGEVLSVSSDGSWGITGLWAAGDKRVICVSSGDVSQGSYLGVWSEDFSRSVAWLHVPTAAVTASANGSWLVWGAGSQDANSDMYAYRFSDGKLVTLGEAPGYSRPAIAADNDTVIVPVVHDATSPVSFRVGGLA